MKIVICGGTGLQAWAGAIYLLEQPDVTEILLADLDEGKIEERIARLNNDSRLKAKALDIRDHEAAVEVFKGYDVVFNCTPFSMAIAGARPALEAGANYLDLASYFLLSGEVLQETGVSYGISPEQNQSLRDDFKEKGLVGVAGLGSVTGAANIAAAYAIGLMDEPESVDIRTATVDIVPPEEHTRPLYCYLAIENFQNLWYADAPFFNEGKLKFVPAKAYPEMVEFKPPIGRTMTGCSFHTEAINLSETFRDRGLKHVSFKCGVDIDTANKMVFLRDLGLLGAEPVDVDGVKIIPKNLFYKLVSNQPAETKKPPDFRGHWIVMVKGKKNGKRIEYIFTDGIRESLAQKMKSKGLLSPYKAAIYGGVGVMMIGHGQALRKGFFYPHEAFKPEVYLQEATKAGIDIDMATKVSF